MIYELITDKKDLVVINKSNRNNISNFILKIRFYLSF